MLHIYIYIFTHLYMYVYINIYTCLRVCVCVPLLKLSMTGSGDQKKNHIIPISYDILAYSPFNTYGHQEPHLHPVRTNTLP